MGEGDLPSVETRLSQTRYFASPIKNAHVRKVNSSGSNEMEYEFLGSPYKLGSEDEDLCLVSLFQINTGLLGRSVDFREGIQITSGFYQDRDTFLHHITFYPVFSQEDIHTEESIRGYRTLISIQSPNGRAVPEAIKGLMAQHDYEEIPITLPGEDTPGSIQSRQFILKSLENIVLD